MRVFDARPIFKNGDDDETIEAVTKACIATVALPHTDFTFDAHGQGQILHPILQNVNCH
jgi:hypothetical protein